MALASDAHASFVYLVDNLPTWRTSVDSLFAHTAEKHAEFVAEYARLLSEAKPRHRRTASNSSVRPEENNAVTEEANGVDSVDDLSSPDPRQTNPFEAGNKYLFAQTRRKRKPGTSIRSGASGPLKFRNRSHVVVYYDGYLQEQLDSMVKQVGVGRNNLRKGKAAFTAATGFRLPTLSGKVSHGLSMFDDVRPVLMSRNTSPLLPGKKPVVPHVQSTSTDEASFLRVDKELEQIQSLCEMAAHQFLRDGDCKTELENVRQKLDALLVQATTTAESLKKLKEEKLKEEQEASQADSCDSDQKPNSDSNGTPSTTQPGTLDILSAPGIKLCKDLRPMGFGLRPEGLLSAPALPTLPTVEDAQILPSDTIEVDDASDQESIVVDLSQYRLANPRRVRI